MVFRDWTSRCCQAHAEAKNLDEWREAHSAACPCRGECGCSMFQPFEDVDASFTPLDANVPYVGPNHPETAQEMARKIFSKLSVQRMKIYGAVEQYMPEGATDYELEDRGWGSHQSLSGCTHELREDGWLRWTGEKRVNRYTNMVNVNVIGRDRQGRLL